MGPLTEKHFFIWSADVTPCIPLIDNLFTVVRRGLDRLEGNYKACSLRDPGYLDQLTDNNCLNLRWKLGSADR